MGFPCLHKGMAPSPPSSSHNVLVDYWATLLAHTSPSLLVSIQVSYYPLGTNRLLPCPLSLSVNCTCDLYGYGVL